MPPATAPVHRPSTWSNPVTGAWLATAAPESIALRTTVQTRRVSSVRASQYSNAPPDDRSGGASAATSSAETPRWRGYPLPDASTSKDSEPSRCSIADRSIVPGQSADGDRGVSLVVPMMPSVLDLVEVAGQVRRMGTGLAALSQETAPRLAQALVAWERAAVLG